MQEASDQIEQSLIGGIISNPANLVLLPSLESNDFMNPASRAAFDAIRNLEASGRHIDIVTIGEAMESSGIDGSRAFAFLGECSLCFPTIGNAIEYARLLRDRTIRRRLNESLSEIIESSKRGASGAEMLSAAIAAVSRLDSEQPEDASTIGEVVKRRIAQLEKIDTDRRNGAMTLTGYPTGVDKLDKMLGGWQPGIVSIIAARPAMGKSSLGLATADASSSSGFGAHLFSLEDTESAYADRALSRTSMVPAELMRRSDLDRGQMADVGTAFRKLGQRKGWLFDGRSGITADEIVRSVRRRLKSNNTKVAIIDYIQLVKRPPRISPHEAISEIITTFADAAKQDGLAYVVMSQLNREIEKREDKRPQQSDLRESGSLEERSKCIVGVYRGSVYGDPKPKVDWNPDTESAPSFEEFERTVQLLVLKNSNGQTGLVRASWSGPTTRIS